MQGIITAIGYLYGVRNGAARLGYENRGNVRHSYA